MARVEKNPAWPKDQDVKRRKEAKIGPPTFADATAIAQAYVKAAPERLVWGSDWPHPSAAVKPDDAMLFDLLAAWAPEEAARNRILVANPQTLYGFPNSA